MAKYDVTYSCGHTETIELFGKESDRQRKIEYYEERGLCSECYKNMIKTANETALAKYPLPELVGSEKQIAYAKTKIAKFVRENEDTMDKYGKFSVEFNSEKTMEMVKSHGMTMEQALNNVLSKKPMFRIAHTILNETNAGIVIDAII